MRLTSFIRTDAILPDLKATTAREAVDEMVGALVKVKALPAGDRKKVVDAVLRREKKGTTGFGNGVAIPHAKQDGGRHRGPIHPRHRIDLHRSPPRRRVAPGAPEFSGTEENTVIPLPQGGRGWPKAG